MASVMMMNRGMMGPAGMGEMPMTPAPASMPAAAGAMVLPRCTMKMEKCAGGMKIKCICDDDVACATLQNLCKMLCDGMCSCCCMMNGMCMCQCNMAMAICKCEYTKDGVCVTCTSGDKACCAMIQACCDCMCECMEAGCTCCLCFNNTPVCCGTC